MQIKLFKKEKVFKKRKESLWLNINLYWKLAVFCLFVVFLLSSFFGYYLFTQINKEFIVSEDARSSQSDTVKKERINKVLEYFSGRDQKSDQIISSPAPIIDPSL